VALPARPNVGRLGYPSGGSPRTIVVPYAVPVYYGDPYAAAYAEPQPAPNVTVIVPQQPTPSIVINHNYLPDTARPSSREYGELSQPGVRVYEAPGLQSEREAAAKQAEPAAPPAPADDRPNIYLIALKDSSVRSAIGFWVEGGTLHYVTPQGSVNRVTLDMVDRQTSERLNGERNLEFKLKMN
jgi:hypothetical protein